MPASVPTIGYLGSFALKKSSSALSVPPLDVTGVAPARLHVIAATLLGVGMLTAHGVSHAASGDLSDDAMGATCTYFNRAEEIKWKNRLGDWIDATAQPQGATPFASSTVRDRDARQVIQWDVKSLVSQWATSGAGKGAILVRAIGPSGYAHFHSSESSDTAARPRLKVVLTDGRALSLPVQADAYLSCSTTRGLGEEEILKVGSTSQHVVAQFDVSQLTEGQAIKSATLEMTTTTTQYGEVRLGVMQLAVPGGNVIVAPQPTPSPTPTPTPSASKVLRLSDDAKGATCSYINWGGMVPWQKKMGDWMDVTGQVGGETPFAATTVSDLDATQTIKWDITALVKAWAANPTRASALMLRNVPGSSGRIRFHSREASTSSTRPRLTVTTATGRVVNLPATADTSIKCTTAYSKGADNLLYVGARDEHSALQFDLAALNGEGVAKAVLQLTTNTTQYGQARIGVMQLHSPILGDESTPPVMGIAANYRDDVGLKNDPNVLVFTDFEQSDWKKPWMGSGNYVLTSTDPGLKFEPWQGKALRAVIPAGSNTALNLLHYFGYYGAEPEEIYFRYYARFADDWEPRLSGGKLPGIAGTYGRGGWGGSRATGTNGWSARGAFFQNPPPGNSLQDHVPIGSYAYHVDQATNYGDKWAWMNGVRGVLERNRWYSVEQYVKMNTPGKNDGILRAWIDGRLAFEKTNIRWRDISTLKIESVWLNVYHGGQINTDQDLHMYLDNIVIARKYIGPMKR